MKKIIEITNKFFNDGRGIMHATEVTKDDFKIEEYETPKEQVIERWKNKDSYIFIRIQLTMTMKKHLIEALDSLEYFSRWGKVKLEEHDEKYQKDQITRTVTFSYDLHKRLKTDKGGKIRNEKKVLERIDELYVKLRQIREEREDEKIKKDVLDKINHSINRIVEDNNQRYYTDIKNNLTSRSKLDELIELNREKKNGEIDKLQEEFEIEKGKIDAEIDVYRKKIAELQKEKSKKYIETSKKFFGDMFDSLPDDLKQEIEEMYEKGEAFTASSRGGFPVFS